ncbi:hypothetical protein Zmor_018249 [Zophobas morio]|uniref:Uncharacterized protein n=1 Tax=Zophobas morio TaxID=2755281 RepID=A0AA38IAV6_9CUCU|nr:hypothetical protein Zmor_018249 [Zophobas morio]
MVIVITYIRSYGGSFNESKARKVNLATADRLNVVIMDDLSSDEEEIRKMEEEIKRKKEQRKHKKQLEEMKSGLLHTSHPEEGTSYSSPKTFTKLGTVDYGKKYEILIIANIALQMIGDSKIRDFCVSSNGENFGDFDSVVIEIETDREIKTKALRLHHSNTTRKLTIPQLIGNNGHFSLMRYFHSVQKVQGEVQEFILFTTNPFETSKETKFKLEGEEFYLQVIKKTVSEDDFGISRISESINYYHTFQIVEDEWTKKNPEKIQQYRTFFEHFRIYANQEKFATLRISTINRFIEMFCSNAKTFKEYVNVISEWDMKEGRKEKLSKKMIQRAVALCLLSSQIEPVAFGLVTEKMKILGDAISRFDITLLETKNNEAVTKLWGDLNKNVDLNELNKVRSLYSLSFNRIKSIENLDAKLLTQLLWLMNKCPLIIKEHENIEKAIQLCPDAKFVLLCTNINDFLSNTASKIPHNRIIKLDFTTEDPPNKQLEIIRDHQDIEDPTEERMPPKKTKIDAEAINTPFPEKTFKKQRGTADYGEKYKILIMANIALQMISDSKIRDFRMSSEVEGFGCFDDMVIEIETDREIKTKALRLYHSNGKRQLTPQLQGNRGYFSLTEYFKSAQQVQGEVQEFILFTTNTFETSEETKFKLEREGFYLQAIKKTVSEDDFGISRISGNINYYHTFQIVEDEWTKKNPEKIQQYRTFFERFRIYTNQENFSTLRISTINRFIEMFCSNARTFKEYVDIISEWDMKEGRKEKLSKKIIQRAIALCLLSSQIEPVAFGLFTDKMKILADAICRFDITLLETKNNEEVTKLWGDLNKNVDLNELNKVRSLYSLSFNYIGSIENLDAKLLTQLLWLMDKCPLIIKEHENIEKAIQLCPDAKFVVLCNNVNEFFGNTVFKIPHTRIFKERMSKCTESEFQQICLKIPEPKTIHYFNFANNKDLEWIRSRGDVSELRTYKLLSDYSKNEEEFWSFECSNNINLIIADPGMGKTELTKSLKNNCYSKYWTVILSPQEVNDFFLKNGVCKTSDYVNRLETFILEEKYADLKILDLEMFKMCLNQNKVVYVWDALDEILPRHLKATSELILMLSQNAFIQWITARQHLRSFLENKFKVLSVSIRQFSELEQDNYIRKRLSSIVSSGDMEKPIEEIRSTFEFTKHVDILGIPLQIFMLTEVFLQNEETYFRLLLNRRFLLTDLYRYFIQGKFDFFYGRKVSVPDSYWKEEVEQKREKRLKQYGRLALKTVFPEEIFNGFNVDNIQNDLDRVEKDFATIGVITGLVNGIPKFAHASFAEYFVALFFSENLKIIPRDIFFEERYNNIRFFFDMLAGQESPVHVAILYRNFDELKEFDDEIVKKDDLQRSALHLISSWGQTYPRLEVQKNSTGYVIQADREFSGSLETQEYIKTLSLLLNKCEIFDRDDLFKITPLGYARESKCLGAEMELLQSGKLPLEQSYNASDRVNILYYSALLGYEKVVRMFNDGSSAFKEEVNFTTDIDFQTPLLIASLKEHTMVVEHLVKCGAEIDRTDENGRTPLYVVAERGYEKAVECLAKCGAEINRADKDGQTPLYVASLNDHHGTVSCLLKNEAEINLADYNGRTPLYIASSNGHKETVSCLLTSKTKINLADHNGQTPLHAASSKGHEIIVECLVEGGTKVDGIDNNGRTPLYGASKNGYEKIVEYLVKCGAEINRADTDGKTPLHVASLNGQEGTVRYLLKYQAETNHADNDGQTPLHAASSNGHKKIIECLVKHGADKNRADNDGQTPLDIASSKGYKKMFECLEKYGEKN